MLHVHPFTLTLFREGGGRCKFAHPYLDVTIRKNWGAPKFFTFNIIILDMFCENLAYVAPSLQILEPFPEEDPQVHWSESCKIGKLVNVL